jgi:hypothetical protein
MFVEKRMETNALEHVELVSVAQPGTKSVFKASFLPASCLIHPFDANFESLSVFDISVSHD